MEATVTAQYKQAVTSAAINRKGAHVIPTGIYKGGLLTRNGSTITVGPFVASVMSSMPLVDAGGSTDPRNQANIETTSDTTVTGVSAGDYLALRWHEASSYPVGDYPNGRPTIVHDSLGNLLPYDVIFGQAVGSSNEVSYAKRQNGSAAHMRCRVEPSVAADGKIVVRGGIAYFWGSPVFIADRELVLGSGVFNVYAESSGDVTASESAVPNGALPLAVVTSDGVRIKATDIVDSRPFLSSASVADTFAGATVQSVMTQNAEIITVTPSTKIPLDGTIPQNTEGLEYSALSTTITPRSAANKLRVRWSLNCSASGVNEIVTVAVFRDSASSAVFANATEMLVGNVLTGEFEVTAGSTAATTFKIRVGGHDEYNNFYFNAWKDWPTTPLFGGVCKSLMTVTEVAVV